MPVHMVKQINYVTSIGVRRLFLTVYAAPLFLNLPSSIQKNNSQKTLNTNNSPDNAKIN